MPDHIHQRKPNPFIENDDSYYFVIELDTFMDWCELTQKRASAWPLPNDFNLCFDYAGNGTVHIPYSQDQATILHQRIYDIFGVNPESDAIAFLEDDLAREALGLPGRTRH